MASRNNHTLLVVFVSIFLSIWKFDCHRLVCTTSIEVDCYKVIRWTLLELFVLLELSHIVEGKLLHLFFSKEVESFWSFPEIRFKILPQSSAVLANGPI